jgi:hypothetical protein
MERLSGSGADWSIGVDTEYLMGAHRIGPGVRSGRRKRGNEVTWHRPRGGRGGPTRRWARDTPTQRGSLVHATNNIEAAMGGSGGGGGTLNDLPSKEDTYCSWQDKKQS